MHEIKRILNHFLKTTKTRFMLQIGTAAVLTASFTVVASVLTVSKNLNSILTLWGESIQMSAYISESATDEHVQRISSYLKTNEKIQNSKYVTKPEALQIFRQQMASIAPDLLNDADIIKYIPTSFQLSFKKATQPQDQIQTMHDVAGVLKTMDGIEEVSYGQEWVKNFGQMAKVFSGGQLVFIIVLLSSALFVMANSIFSSIHQRRSEIEVMELIGATQSFIRAPFIYEGMALGFITASTAILFSYGLFESLKQLFADELALMQLSQHIQFFTNGQILFFIICGTLLGIISSWFCVRRINHGWAAAQNA